MYSFLKIGTTTKYLRWCSIIELIVRLLFLGINADLLTKEFLELIEANELEFGLFWYRPKEVKECRFWSKRVNDDEPDPPDSYKEALECLDITDGGAQFPGIKRKSWNKKRYTILFYFHVFFDNFGLKLTIGCHHVQCRLSWHQR